MDLIIIFTFFAATGYSVYKNFRYKQEIKSLRQQKETLLTSMNDQYDRLQAEIDKANEDIRIFNSTKDEIIRNKLDVFKTSLEERYKKEFTDEIKYYKNELLEREAYYNRQLKDKTDVITDLIAKNSSLKGINYELEEFKRQTIINLASKEQQISELELKLTFQPTYSALEDLDNLTFLALPFILMSLQLIIYFGIYWYNYGPLFILNMRKENNVKVKI